MTSNPGSGRRWRHRPVDAARTVALFVAGLLAGVMAYLGTLAYAPVVALLLGVAAVLGRLRNDGDATRNDD